MNQSELGLRIKQCRKMKKLTQENLAELVDVSPHYIYEIERGLKNMSLSIFAEIAFALNISTDYLLFGMDSSRLGLSVRDIPVDRLNLLLQVLSPAQRDNLADILSVLLPHLK